MLCIGTWYYDDNENVNSAVLAQKYSKINKIPIKAKQGHTNLRKFGFNFSWLNKFEGSILWIRSSLTNLTDFVVAFASKVLPKKFKKPFFLGSVSSLDLRLYSTGIFEEFFRGKDI